MDYLDEDSGTVAATIGDAEDRSECEGVVRDETDFYERHGFTILGGEACELCSTCHGDGFIRVDGSAKECPQCGGFNGPLRKLQFRV